jgi:hypothetical protein
MDMDMRRKILVTGWIKLLFKKTILTPEEDHSTNGIRCYAFPAVNEVKGFTNAS